MEQHLLSFLFVKGNNVDYLVTKNPFCWFCVEDHCGVEIMYETKINNSDYFELLCRGIYPMVKIPCTCSRMGSFNFLRSV